MDIEYDVIAQAIEKDGFALIRGLFSAAVIEQYRQECEGQFQNAPRLEGKVYRLGQTPDYVQPWMIDGKGHQVASYRLYQFYHNSHSANTQQIIDQVIGIRDRIEKRWPEVQDYNRRNGFVDYNIVAKYAAEGGYQSKHADMEVALSHPALQCEILLTQPGRDYLGGDLRLYTTDGRIISTTNDLQVQVGDLILFDKRLEHDVVATLPTAIKTPGRWMALIGAKTFSRAPRTYLQDARTKVQRFFFLNTPFLYRLARQTIKAAGLKGSGKTKTEGYTV